MIIKDENELKETISIGTTIVTRWDKEVEQSVFSRASFQVGYIGKDSRKYKGVAGNQVIEVHKLGAESQQKMQQIGDALRFIWDEVKAGYPNYVPTNDDVEV